MLVWISPSVKPSDLPCFGHRTASGNHDCLALLAKWAMAVGILAESVSSPLIIPTPQQEPPSSLADEAEVG